MAYYYDPYSYANSFHSSPFVRRRPSPPPTTYYPRASCDPYLRALAEEQAARTDLQEAIQRERLARQRRAQEEAQARARALEQARKEALKRQRVQQQYFGLPAGYGYPGFGFGNYEDDEEQEDEDDYSFSPFFNAMKREPTRRQSPKPVPRQGSQSRSPPREEQQHTEPTSPKVSIPITSPSRPEPTSEEQNAAASKIQSAYRAHASLSSISSLRERFANLLTSFSFPSTLDFDSSSSSSNFEGESEGEARPKLAYSSHNAPLHAHEDALLKLLQALDAVESHGDARVREARRELVREIERELARVDAEVRKRWEELHLEKKEEKEEVGGEAMDAEPTPIVSSQGADEAVLESAEADAEAPVEAMDSEPIAPTPTPTPTEQTVHKSPDSADLPIPLSIEPSTEQLNSEEAMDVEVEPYVLSSPFVEDVATVTEPIIEDAATASEPIIEDAPFLIPDSAVESPAESELDVQTPPLPRVSLPLPSPVVHQPELEPEFVIGVNEVRPEPVLEKGEMDDALAFALPVAPPQPTSEPELKVLEGDLPNNTSVPEQSSVIPELNMESESESDAEVEEELVLVDAVADTERPHSPVPSIEPEKEFVMV